MEQLIAMMKKRLAISKEALRIARKSKVDEYDGCLRVSVANGYVRYYQVTDNCKNGGKYLKKTDLAVAKKLAQKKYKADFIKACQKEINYLEKTIRFLSSSNANLVYDNLSNPRKILVDPYILDNEIYAKKWQEKEFKTNNFMLENKIYDTKRGDKVRSKSEALIANVLYDLNIPYQYEKALFLENGVARFPDFTLLNKVTREEIYFEHFGLLEDKEYLMANLKKLDEYQTIGIYPGKNLIFSYETKENPLNITNIKKMLCNLLG